MRLEFTVLLLLAVVSFIQCQPHCQPDRWRAYFDPGTQCFRNVIHLCKFPSIDYLSHGLSGVRGVHNDRSCGFNCPDDSTVYPRWYRIGGFSDNSIPEFCPVNDREPNVTLCGQATYPSYLVNVNPENRSRELVWTAEVCHTSMENECCDDNSTRSQVLLYHCAYDIVYYLVPLNSSEHRYCTANRPRCAFGYMSPTGFWPCTKLPVSNITVNTSVNTKTGWISVDGSPLLDRKTPPGAVSPVAIFLIVLCAVSLAVLTVAGIIVITCWSKHEDTGTVPASLQPIPLITTTSLASNGNFSNNDSQPNGVRRRNNTDISWADDEPGRLAAVSSFADGTERKSVEPEPERVPDRDETVTPASAPFQFNVIPDITPDRG